MMKINRPPVPDFLEKNSEQWTKNYMQRLQNKSDTKFEWPTHNGKKINELLYPELKKMTANHCSFCDGYPIGPIARNTIEHFKPKSVSGYPEEAYSWENLFLSCDVCQNSKKDNYDSKLLKPDVEDYEFEKYFTIAYRTGDIEVNLRANQEDQKRAKVTIDMYGLNEEDRPHYRREELEKYSKDKDIDIFSYRFFIKESAKYIGNEV